MGVRGPSVAVACEDLGVGVLAFSLLAVAAAVEAAARAGPRRRLALGASVVSLGSAVAFLAFGGFEARKVAAHLLMPAGAVWVALFALTALDARRRRWRRGALSLCAFLLYTAAGSVPLGYVLVRGLEAEVPAPPERATAFDAAFVLGGGVGVSPAGEPELGAAGDRLRLAAELWREGRAETLVASGFSPPPFGLGDLAALTREIWVDAGVPRRAIVELSDPTDTRSEIRAYVELARARGWRRLALVSSAWHLPRALELAREAGLEVVPFAADHRAARPPQPSALWAIPQRGGFELTHIWAWERLGRALGR